MEDVLEIVYINNLYDLYKELLTEKQRNYFEAFYLENMSLSEIADAYNVSRNAIYSQLNLVKESLYDYENKLNLLKKIEKREKIIQKIKEKSDKDLSKLLDELMEV